MPRKNKKSNKQKKSKFTLYFLLSVILFYLFFAIADRAIFTKALGLFISIIIKIIPIFLLIFVLMVLTNYFLNAKKLARYFSENKPVRSWIIAIVAGIISSGPIYMWYPLLAEFRKNGVNYGLIACFLYNRAIKISILPLMIVYFSLKYVVVLGLVMIFLSVFQGIIVNRILEVN